MNYKRLSVFLLILILFSNKALALSPHNNQSLYISVASNFTETLKDIVASYQKKYPQSDVKIISGATTNLYNQIINGAPFDIFLSADQNHIDLLIKKGLVLPEDSFIYAKGKLVLWASQQNINNQNQAQDFLSSGNFNHIVIPKPDLAPYGIAAKQVLTKLKLFKKLQSDNKLIYSQNVLSAMGYVANNSIDVGFVALSQIISWQKKANLDLKDNIWIIPEDFYEDIIQKVAILNLDKKDQAQRFLNFLKSKKAKNIIKSYGYGIM